MIARALGGPGGGRAAPLVGLLVTLAFSLPAWAPILSPDFSLWQVDDGRLHLHRAFFLRELIADGNWYPRWMPQQFGGYGYPTLNFYAPGLYYLVVAIAALPRLGLYEGMQAAAALAAVVIILGTYWWVWLLWRHPPAAFLAAISVAVAPYVIHGNVYLSGSITHALGLAALVLILVAVTGLWFAVAAGGRVLAWWWFVAAITAAVFLSHNAVTAIAAPVAAAWTACLFLWRPSRRGAILTATAALAGTAAVAVLWVPALTSLSLVQIENNQHGNLNYRNHFLAWPGLHREDVWGLQTRGAWTPGFPIDLHPIYPHSLYGPVRLGLTQAVIWIAGVLALSAFALPRLFRRPARRYPIHSRLPDRRLAGLTLAYGLFLAVACYSQTFDWALPWWDRLPFLRSIQLPSRLLAPAIFALALVLGAVFALAFPNNRRAWAAALLIALALSIAGLGGRPLPLELGVSHQMDLATVASDQRQKPGFTDSMDEFLPRTAGYETWHEGEARGFWLYQRVFPEAAWVGGRVRAWAGDLAVRGLRGGLLWTAADVDAGPNGATLALHQLAFPGWRAWIDGRPARLEIAPRVDAQAIAPGFILVAVPPGRHEVAVRFGPDWRRLAGAAVSLFTLAAGALWLFRRRSRVSAGALAIAVIFLALRTVAPLWPPG